MKLPASPQLPAPRFLTAPGELGAQILAFDWAGTPLGPIEQWPQSLKTVVSLMLSSRQPMWIGWGDQATFLYNDAYVGVLSMAKHPWALGRPAAEVWAEIWDICGPLADRVFAHGEATLADDVRLFMSRGDFLEETFYSFSYSPVRDESGNVAGLFCPNLDVTTKHLNARRLRTLSDMSTRMLQEKTVHGACTAAMTSIAANPDDLPFALLYLADADADADADGGAATLAQATHADIPASWFPVEEVIADAATRVVDLAHAPVSGRGREGGLPMGLANQPIRQALVLPLLGSGTQHGIGALVLGVSAARRLDADYRRFLELIAIQTGNAIQQARAAEEERLHAAMLTEIDRAKTQFFSNVSHEFRTPLTLMLGPMEDALHDAAEPLPPAQRARMELMRRNGLRLQKLVNTLLEFSRVQAGRAQASFAPTDLAALTADLASSFRSAIEGAGMRLVVDCPPLPAPVYIDPGLWEKIVLNLLSNAFKFTFEGQIGIGLHPHGAHVRLTVSDSGTGIPADQLPHLFERFHRVEGARSRTHEGSGIGLALVHDLVALHGGAIGVESVPGSGTVFAVDIPLGCAHLDPAYVRERREPWRPTAVQSYVAEVEGWIQPAATPPGPAPDPRHGPRQGRLLIVDDNADMRDYLQRLLRDQWHVEVRNNGVEALAAVRQATPDIILSDVMMPELDGFGLLAALRGDPATRDIPFMLLSARAGEEARLEGLQAGADDYLVKPFSSRELATRIELLRLRQQARMVDVAVARRTQSIFSQAPVAIAILRGPEHVFEQANASYQEVVGPRPLVGLPVRQVFPELEGQGIFELLDGVLATGQPYIGRSVPLRIRRGPDQQEMDCCFDFVYQPLLDEAGRPEGVAAVVFEVTELANAKRAAETANRAKDEFLAMLGHELRNPLAPIVTALQLMRLRGGDYALKERAVIERQTRHLVALVDDLLDVARVAEGKIQLRRQAVEMSEVVARAIETASPLIEEKRHALEVQVPSAGLAVMADPGRFAQVLANLLTNAAKYTEPQGRLSVHAWREGGDAVVSVRDNGIGISASMLASIFDLFVQERQALSRSRGGLGLGLTIAKSMMALHGGSITARSDGEGLGSTFTIRMPALEQVFDAPRAAPAVAAQGGAAAPAGSGLTLMVVDDNEDAAQAVGEALEMMGHTVHVMFGAPEALARESVLRPDVCLLDIGLPGMDGYELAQRLRQQAGGRPLRLIAVTGYGQDSDRRRAAEAGFNSHLTKPVDLMALDNLLRGTV